jgi:tetratricopeptide (TPR) repeat protein
MFLLLRLGAFYCHKHAFQNAFNALRRAVEIKAAEVAFRRNKAQRARTSSKTMNGRNSVSAALAPTARPPPRMLRRAGAGGMISGAVSGQSSLSSLLPFALPSSTRLLSGVLFMLGVVHLRTGDLEEALAFFERARLVAARIVARRYRKEKSDKDNAWNDTSSDAAAAPIDGGAAVAPAPGINVDTTSPDVSSANAAFASPSSACEAADTAWTLSSSFLSSLATPGQVADVMAYVRAVYMLSITHDRMGAAAMRAEAEQHSYASMASAASASAPPPPPVSARTAATVALHSYRALVLRRSVIALWHRVAAGHKVISPHEDMWRVCAGMSVLAV